MNKNNWLNNSVLRPIKSHSAEILLVMGLLSGASAIVLGIVATPKAMSKIEKRKEELETEILPVKEIVKTTWKCYVPTVTTALFSAGCIIGSNHENMRKIVAVNAAYNLSEVALSEYQKKVTEIVGPEKEHEVREAVAKDQITNHPVSQQTVIVTGMGDHLCFDSISERYFRSSIVKIQMAAVAINHRLLDERYVALDELYYELGINGIPATRELGWNVDDGRIELEFSSQLSEEGEPCIVIRYNTQAKINYQDR